MIVPAKKNQEPPSSWLPFSGALHYLVVFRRHLGRRLYLVFGLGLLAALTESLGIAMLLPLLAALDVGLGAAEGTPPALSRIVAVLGLGGSLVGLLLFIAALFVVKGMINFAANAYGGYLQAQLLRELKSKMFAAFKDQDYERFMRSSTGHFVNLLNQQINQFYQAFGAYKGFVTNAIKAMGYVGVALWLSWQFGLLALSTGLVLFVVFRRLNAYVKSLSRKAAAEMSTLNKLLVQAVQAFKYLRSTQQLDGMHEQVERSVRRVTGYRVRQQVWQAFTGALNEPLSVLLIVGILLVLVGWMKQPLAPILVSILLFHRAMTALFRMQAQWQQTMTMVGSVEMVENELRSLGRSLEPSGRRAAAPFSREIRLDGVSFEYPEAGRSALGQIDLVIPARTTVAVVGPSGAGKSTLVDLLTLMLRPCTGRICIDGVDAAELDAASWRRQIGYVCQDTVVFDASIATNIAMQPVGERDAELLARIREAARQADLAEFIEALPKGWFTAVGDRGIKLSGGQRQRLFIARELFRRPALLILDEATSALDGVSERAVQQSLAALHGALTVVIVAHRLATVRDADQIVVLDAGRIVEQGSYADLRADADSLLSRMSRLQAV